MTITKKQLVFWSIYWMLSFLTGLLYPQSAKEFQPLSATNYTNTASIVKYDTGNSTTSGNYLIDDINLDLTTCIQESTDSMYPSYGTGSMLTLIDKNHFVTDGYGPNDLTFLTSTNYPVQYNMYVSQAILPDLMQMIDDMKAEGLHITIKSGWRTASTQERLYNLWVARVGINKAKYYAAEPGHSEHHLGTTVDLGYKTAAFTDSKADHWLRANAYKYGFVMSYPENSTESTGYTFEPWHYRYVGIDVATTVKERDISLSEYLYEYHNVCAR